ncbi:MAG: hypothetical protein AMJ62_01750 [Myxococcales bacterium SG8_38]|nr:MAG: hypothetical protein AMJ62_01750 [Myxococcales bacterium SG8_38]
MLGLIASAATADETRANEAQSSKGERTEETVMEQTSVGQTVVEMAAPDWRYPKAIASRPLTMKKFMIRGTFIVDVKRAVYDRAAGMLADKPLVSVDLGAAFAVFDNLEVGVSGHRIGSTPANAAQDMFPIVVSPTGRFGDMPLFVRYRFLRRSYFEMAGDVVLLIPTGTNLALTLSLPMRIRTRAPVTIDTGLHGVVLSNGAGLNVDAPVKATYSITSSGFLFGESGFSFQNLARNLTGGSYDDSNLAFPVARNQVLVPMVVGGGYTHVLKNVVMLDIFAQFGWRPLVYLNPPSGADVVPVAKSWVLAVGVAIHTSPVLQRGDL